MKSTSLLALLMGLLFIQGTIAEEILEVLEPEEGSEIVADLYGDTKINIKVQNTGESTLYNCSLVFDGDLNFTLAYDNLTLGSGSAEYFEAHGLGIIDGKETVKVRVECVDSGDNEFRSPYSSFILVEPKPHMKIIAPSGTKIFTSLPLDGSVPLTVIVENDGDVDLQLVGLAFENKTGSFTCTSTGRQNIPRNRNANYDVKCIGMETGDRLGMTASDRMGWIEDYEAIVVILPPEIKSPSLRILQPNPGSTLSIDESNNLITVRVKNEGSADATEVCMTLSNIQYTIVGASRCADIAAGATVDFRVVIQTIPDVPVSATISVSGSQNAQAGVQVSFRRIQTVQPSLGDPVDTPPDNLTNLTNGTNATIIPKPTLEETLDALRVDVYKNNILIVSTQLIVMVILVYNLLLLRRASKD
ncbi:MAG: hypothetical protein JXB14_08015 [Candidatus Altiarchaeota archaeon]|nr:hypothetical protein [Candidatus Altiarchaeota archaeon]